MVDRIRKATNERDQGFSLIELLVVIIIIGILSAIAIPVFLNQRKKGVDASVKADVRSLALAAEAHGTDYPGALLFSTAAPDPVAAASTNLKAAGFNKTPGNVIQISGGPQDGYCIRGSNPGSTGGSTTWQWYNSNTGGLAPGAPTAAVPTAYATGPCAAPAWLTM